MFFLASGPLPLFIFVGTFRISQYVKVILHRVQLHCLILSSVKHSPGLPKWEGQGYAKNFLKHASTLYHYYIRYSMKFMYLETNFCLIFLIISNKWGIQYFACRPNFRSIYIFRLRMKCRKLGISR